ncbi:hypothetical protein E4191_16495 (plasmid) [Paracoccus liaowanqingii]|uniref:Uncharacterized protein n=1 Tax=Paracoccus liaowanqingii TaxID=2560053 RepID=A0A4Y5SSS0_9RHOB|nr:hypothetical protein [Paracoccus liaowanqingii]QDA35764.1 hypothetical protein E4191_16495 [Paracoccus liaowanqingii]
MAFTSADRQRIIDDYLAQTGRPMFIPGEFVDWLAGEPEHEAYDWFYGMDDVTAAREHRIAMARRMAGGLRITVSVQEVTTTVVHIAPREYPAFISPMSTRRSGGGYTPFDPHNPADMAELQREGAVAMQSWLNRYAGAFADTDLSVMREIAARASPPALSA